MKSRLQLCVLVLFVYVAVVNVMIVRQLLARLHARAEKMGANVSVEQAPVRTDVDLALRRARPASCHPTREWVVCVVAERTGTNQRIGGLPARLADISQTAVRMGVLGTSVRAVHLG